MRFAEPWAFLLAMLLPLVIAFDLATARVRRKRLERAGDPELIEGLSSVPMAELSAVRRRQQWLFALAFLLVVVAVARPQFGTRTETRQSRGMDLIVALDLSQSMYARDVAPSRLERARVEIEALLDRIPKERVGLVGFTSIAVPLCPLTVDHATLKLQLRAADPKDLPHGGTSIARALEQAKDMLASSKSGAGKAIVVVTDGEDHEGEAEKLAKEALEAGILVHVVGVGSRTGEPIPIVDESGTARGYLRDQKGETVITRLDAEMLEQLAEAGGGVAALPSARGGLDFSLLTEQIDRMQKAELESRTVQFHEERYPLVLWPAFLLLLLATLWRPGRPWSARVTSGLLLAFLVSLPEISSAQPWQTEDTDVKRGNLALQDGKPKDALTAYEAARQRLGEDPRLAFNRGLAAVQDGELEKAREAFEQARAGSTDPILRSQAELALGNTYRRLKKYDEAAGAYQRALLEDPKLEAARRNLELAQAMKRIAKLAPPNPDGDQNDDEKEPPKDQDGGPPPDAGTDGGAPPDAGAGDGSSADGGGSSSEDSGSTSDGGGESQGQDAGTGSEDAESSPPPSAPEEEDEEAEALERQDVEQLLDALQDQEKAAARKRLEGQMKRRPSEKNW